MVERAGEEAQTAHLREAAETLEREKREAEQYAELLKLLEEMRRKKYARSLCSRMHGELFSVQAVYYKQIQQLFSTQYTIFKLTNTTTIYI